jgi:asparagine synthase (glutamine-hydrolysing)
MCGICGLVYFDREKPVPEETLRFLTDSMAHRGPDDSGYFLAGHVGLGHRRLSIIDLERGRQPICNEDESVVVVLNGEIYNFQEIRAELSGSWHRFVTDSDTEVLVHGYEEWGIEGLLKRCNGMFAFGLYDRKKDVLFLVRDRMGKKPLYYAALKDGLAFASELRGLVAGGLVPKAVDPVALNHYVRLHFPYGAHSLIRGIERVLPGQYLRVDLKRGACRPHRYWVLRNGARPEARTLQDSCERLRFLLRDSVRLRRIADVPVGTFLSGGLDSSLITGLLSELIQPLNTFSIGFEQAGFDESPYSKAVSSFFGTEHQHLLLTGKKFAALLGEILKKMDEPLADAAIVPTYWLSREARKSVTVILTGEGSDELFAGYDYYEGFLKGPLTPQDRAEIRRKILRLPSEDDPPRSLLSGFSFTLPEGLQRQLIRPEYRVSGSLRQYYETLQRGYDLRDGTHLDQALMADMRGWLVDDVLMKLDKMSMLNSLEVRAPFLDYRLVEFALSVPDEFRIRQGAEKFLLKEAFRDFLPRPILARRKQGFNLPVEAWMRSALRPLVMESLSPSRIRKSGFFDDATLSTLIERHQARRASYQRILLAVLMFEMWWESL